MKPRWIGFTLFGSALMMVTGNFVIAPGGLATNLVVNLLSNMGLVLLLIAVGDLGCLALLAPAPDDQ